MTAVSKAFEWWDKNGPNKAVTALGIGAGTALIANLALKNATGAVRALASPFVKDTPKEGLVALMLSQTPENKGLRRYLSAATGALAGLGFAAATYNTARRYGGMFNNHEEPFNKHAFDDGGSFFPSSDASYLQAYDYTKRIDSGVARTLFQTPSLQGTYAGLAGTAIVNSAAGPGEFASPTLGSIFDAAKDKIDKHLSFSGVAKVATRTFVANRAARLFTGAVGMMCDLPDSVRDDLVTAGTWAGAISAILE